MAYTPFSYKNYTTKKYTESDAVDEARKALEAQLAAKPEAYKSQWQTQLDDTMNKILNREKFSYDFNGDALYQQYKDKFIQQGKMASADVMGQAAAMTGGYGNSYAATVGNQAYQASLQNLNDIVPELYQMALDQYNQQGQELYNQYGLIADRENTDYGKYRDTVADWTSNRDYLANRYDSERNYDYGMYQDNRNFDYGVYSDDKSYAYQTNADQNAYDQWEAEYNQKQAQIDLENRNIDAEVEAKYNDKVSDWADYVADLETKAKQAQAPNNTPKEPEEPEDAGTSGLTTPADWGTYLGAIRSSQGAEAAEAELSRAMKAGEIPREATLSAVRAARGGTLGH